MMDGGAYGGSKAGTAFDPLQFIQRPQVILRAVCWLFAIIVFGCISSEGYHYDPISTRHKCSFNEDQSACSYGVGIGVIAFLACIGFLVGEYMFEQMSSVKTRRHYVMLDLGFSGLWTFLFFVGFCLLANRWSNSKPNSDYGVHNIQAAIAFSFFSIFSWAGCTWFAYQRFRQGSDSAFATGYDTDATSNIPGAGGNTFSSYPGGPDSVGGGYNEPPFGATQGRGQIGDYQPPAY